VKPGTRGVVATANGDGYRRALDLIEAGLDICALVDLREAPDPDPRIEAVKSHRIRILTGTLWSKRFPARQARHRRRCDCADHR
jgi:sarcosine oxidase subunit alpha